MQQVIGSKANRANEYVQLHPPREQGIVGTEKDRQGKTGNRDHDRRDAKDLFAGSIRCGVPGSRIQRCHLSD
jgi:hypothetical protein